MIRLGILGAGNIAHRFMKGVQGAETFSVVSVYARKADKAKQFADDFNIQSYTDDLHQFLNHDELDAVYIATPNFLHFENVMQALRAGLHCMVEKPAFIEPAQALSAYQFAQEHNLILMEAMKVCYLPTTQKAKQWLNDGKIGKVIQMEASFCRKIDIDASHPIFDVQKGGGALFDVGCYALAMVRELLNEPNHVDAWFHLCASGVDDTAELLLTYQDTWASIQASFLLDKQNAAIIYGSEGTITIPDFWKSHRMELQRYDGLKESFICDQPSEFTPQINYFADLILGKVKSNASISGLLNCGIIKEAIEHGYNQN